MTVPRVIVVAGSIALVGLVLVVGVLILRGNESDALLVVSNAHWGACTQDQAGKGYQCQAVAKVTNDGGSRGAQVFHYLAFYLPDGTGCDVDIPQLEPGAAQTLSCAVAFGSNYPGGSGPGLAPSDPPRAIVRTP
jgi:hypothetical protein